MLNRQVDTSNKIERVNNEYMNNILGNSYPVLDHGFVRVIDYMGDDSAIVQAARVSYGEGTKTVRNDRALIRYLMRHMHTTPFEMCEIKLHVKLPVFVARQWIRHRTANVNEYSARYSILDREFYIPEPEDLAVQSTDNKQGRGDSLTAEQALYIREWLMNDANNAYDTYNDLVLEKDKGGEYGLARELARMNLPTNIYTQWYWKVNLHNLFHFLKLRADPHAQYEIRVYANMICDLIKPWVPAAFGAFEDYKMNAYNFSFQEIDAIKRILVGEKFDPEWLSEREAKEFMEKLNIA